MGVRRSACAAYLFAASEYRLARPESGRVQNRRAASHRQRGRQPSPFKQGISQGGKEVTVRIGVMIDTEVPFERVISQVASLRDAGIQTAWASQIFAYDALTALAAIGREVDGIDLGTAVVPTYPRHPVMMAGQALTVQAATGEG